MKLLDMMRQRDHDEQMADFEERLAAAQAHGALVRISRDAGDDGDYDTQLLAWLLTGSSNEADEID